MNLEARFISNKAKQSKAKQNRKENKNSVNNYANAYYLL
jgi:hypothetical protein